MAEVKEVPQFQLTQKFFDGGEMHEPGEKLTWAVPEGWDEKKQGRHYVLNGPSVTFQPLNKAAEELLAKQRAMLQK